MILVSQEGKLVGLVTVKDVLRHEAHQHHLERSAASTPITPRHRQNHSNGSINAWNDSWAVVEEDQRGHGLEIALTEGYAWVVIKGSRAMNMLNGLYRRARGQPSSGYGGSDPRFDYELEEERERS